MPESGGRKCTNKVCSRTSALRWVQCLYQGKKQLLCHLCHSYLVKDRCCPYCDQIYRQGDVDMFDGEPWLECSACLRWVHAKCETSHGLRQGMAMHSMSQKDEKKAQCYLCPACCVEEQKKKSVMYLLFAHQVSLLSVARPSGVGSMARSSSAGELNLAKMDKSAFLSLRRKNRKRKGVVLDGLPRFKDPKLELAVEKASPSAKPP